MGGVPMRALSDTGDIRAGFHARQALAGFSNRVSGRKSRVQLRCASAYAFASRARATTVWPSQMFQMSDKFFRNKAGYVVFTTPADNGNDSSQPGSIGELKARGQAPSRFLPALVGVQLARGCPTCAAMRWDVDQQGGCLIGKLDAIRQERPKGWPAGPEGSGSRGRYRAKPGRGRWLKQKSTSSEELMLPSGGSDRRRSGDLSIFSRTLYQLSYRA